MKITGISKLLFIFMASTMVFTSVFTATDILSGNLTVAYASDDADGGDSATLDTSATDPADPAGDTGSTDPDPADPAGGDEQGTDEQGTDGQGTDEQGTDGQSTDGQSDVTDSDPVAGDSSGNTGDVTDPAADPAADPEVTDPNSDSSDPSITDPADPENPTDPTGDEGENTDPAAPGDEDTGEEGEQTGSETDDGKITRETQISYTLNEQEYNETIGDLMDKAIALEITMSDMEIIMEQLEEAGIDVTKDAMVQATLANLNQQLEEIKKEYEELQNKPPKVVEKVVTRTVTVPSSSSSGSGSSTGRSSVSIPSIATSTTTVPKVAAAIPNTVSTLTTKLSNLTATAGSGTTTTPITAVKTSGEATYEGDDDDYGINTIDSLKPEVTPAIENESFSPLVVSMDDSMLFGDTLDEYTDEADFTDPVADALFAEGSEAVTESTTMDTYAASYAPTPNTYQSLTKTKNTAMKVGMGVATAATMALIGLYIFGCRMGFFTFDPAGAFRRLTRRKVKASEFNDMISQTIA